MTDHPDAADQPADSDPAEDRVRAVLRDIARVDLAAAPVMPMAVAAGTAPAGPAGEFDDSVVELEIAQPPRRRRGRALVAVAAIVAVVAGAAAVLSRRDQDTPVAAAGDETPTRVVPTTLPDGMSLVAVVEHDLASVRSLRSLLLVPEGRADVQLQLSTQPAPPTTTSMPATAPIGPSPTPTPTPTLAPVPADLPRPAVPQSGSAAPETTFVTSTVPPTTAAAVEQVAATVGSGPPFATPATVEAAPTASPGHYPPGLPYPTTTIVGEPLSDEQTIEVDGGRSVTVFTRYPGSPLAAQTQIGECAVTVITERGTVEDVVAVAALAGCDRRREVTFPTGRGFDVTDLASLLPTSLVSMAFEDGQGIGHGFGLDVLNYPDGVDAIAEVTRQRGAAPATTVVAGRQMVAEEGGAVLIWSEHGVVLQLSAHTLTDAEKTAIIDGLEVVDEDEWQRFAAAAPTDAPPLTGTTMPPPPPDGCRPVQAEPENAAAGVPAGLRLVPRTLPDGWTKSLSLYGRSEVQGCGVPAATWTLGRGADMREQVNISIVTGPQGPPPPDGENITKDVAGRTVTFSIFDAGSSPTTLALGRATEASFAIDGGSVFIFSFGLTVDELEAIIAGLEVADEAEWNDVVATFRQDLGPPCAPPDCGSETTVRAAPEFPDPPPTTGPPPGAGG